MPDIQALLAVVGTGFAFVFGIIVLVSMTKAFRVICAPNEILIVSGKRKKMQSGRVKGYRTYFGEPAWRVPLIHKVDRMDTTLFPITVKTRNAYSAGGIPLIVEAIANVKISTDTRFVDNVAERFLGKPRTYLIQVARETLEGHLRGVIATMTPEEVNEDRLQFAEKIREETGADFHKLGLELDVFKIQHVTDEVSYLENLGREQIANVLKDAEIAESNAQNEAHQAAADFEGQGNVARENAQRIILQKQNELRQIKADLDAQARSEEERAEQAAMEARAFAEQELQGIRAKLEQLRLQADVVIPAEASKSAAELTAAGQAADIAENGKAQAEVLSALNDTWRAAGDQAGEIFLLRQLEDVLEPILAAVRGVSVEKTAIVDAGDGQAIAGYLAAYPQAVLEIMDRLGQATGVDLTTLAAGRTGDISTVAIRAGEPTMDPNGGQP